MEKSGKKLMYKQTLHILHVYFSQVWELSSIIYSLLFLFCISFIMSTQIAASRRKYLKSDVWTLWLDIEIWSLSQKGKLDFSILPIDVICFIWVLSCSKKEIIFICVCFCLNTCILRVIFASQGLRSALLNFTLGIVRRIFIIPAHCHLLDFDSYAPCNDVIFSQSTQGFHFLSFECPEN